MPPEQPNQPITNPVPMNPVDPSLPAYPVQTSPNTNQNSPVGAQNIKSRKGLSVVCLIIFSQLFGGLALYYSFQTDKFLKEGNIEAAQKASKQNKLFIILAIALGLPLSFFYIATRAHA